ncbi:MAG: hypothetical protein IKD73_09435 [Selenomonadaceae bacterium]|nr:hypothetical protein [Selenomonadaceae bacterium]
MLKAEATILLEGRDITQSLEGRLLNLNYRDRLSGEADTIELTLMDKDKLLLTDSFPPRGATASITVNDFDLGAFELDEVDYSAPPNVMRVKATSISQNSGLRQTDESKSWESVLLSKIARDIAEASALELFYQAGYNPEIKRAEQGEQSRLAFLDKLCADNGLIVKVADGKLIVVEEVTLEAQDPVTALTWSDITRFDAKATLNEVYQKCEVNYKHAKQDKLFSATATDDSKAQGRTLKINRRVNSQAEADRLAAHELRNANKKEFQVTITMPLRLNLLAGVVVTLEDFGFFSGKWLVDESSHDVSDSGSVTRITLHRTENQS